MNFGIDGTYNLFFKELYEYLTDENCGLITLDLSNNFLSKTMIKHLKDSLEKNNSIKNIILRNIQTENPR